MEAGIGARVRRIALLLQYDGTHYNGWQCQDIGKTVQTEIERALKILTRESVKTVASGRTDSGVHALGQVVHFDSSTGLKLDKICISLNGILPADIAVRNAYDVPEIFHSRYSAVEREYKYLIYNHPQRSPFMLYRAMWAKTYIEEARLNEAMSLLVGERDFASFCKKVSANEGTIRRLTSASASRSGDTIEILIRGNAFLHNMIRIIVGTAVDLVQNERPPEDILEILEKRDRIFGGKTAPPYGLYLNRVIFDPPLESMKSAF